MKFFYILFGLLLVGVAAMQNLLGLVVLFSIGFAYFFTAWPLFFLALFIDGYYGAFLTVPYFTIGSIVLYVISELIRSKVRIMK